MIEVVALKITDKKISYICPFCYTNKTRTKTYKTNKLKNGRISLNRIPTIHYHGNENENNMGNWSTNRTSHCSVNEFQNIRINITNETLRE